MGALPIEEKQASLEGRLRSTCQDSLWKGRVAALPVLGELLVWLWRKIAKPILEWAEHAHFVAWVVAQWSLIVSAALAIGVGFWAWSAEHAYLPVFLVALVTFVCTIWGFNGIVWLRSQRRPSKQRVAFDYAYGLSLIELHLGLDESKKDAAFQLGIRLFNASDWPIKYLVEDMNMVIGDRAIAKPNFTSMGGIVSRRSPTLFLYPPFPRSAMKKHAEGMMKFSILYGHPDFGFVRRFKRRLSVSLRLDDKPSAVYIVESESDESIQE